MDPTLFFTVGRCVAVAMLMLAACSHPPSPKILNAPVAHTGASPGPSSRLAQGHLTTVSPTGLTLPVILTPQSTADRQFAVVAARALRRVYDEDSDDCAILLALNQQLTQTAYAHMAPVWQPLLAQGLDRAHTLANLAPGLRALRQAYQQAYFDEMSQTLKGIDQSACQTAQGQLSTYAAAHPTWVVTIDPMEPAPLSERLRPCKG